MGRTKISDELIDKHRDINTDYDWWESVYEDFDRVAKILGFDVNFKNISFSGFCNQGDGASFTGSYQAQVSRWSAPDSRIILRNFAETAPAEIRSYAPQDTTLHGIADELLVISRMYFPARASIGRTGTMYSHCATMNIPACEECDANAKFDDEVLMAVADAILVQARALADWLYKQLEAEYEYQQSDAAVTDTIFANDLHK
jgi:hypothetical protein